ncbi:LysR family transcriptional regulator [Mycolicibacterium komossense]|uniref:LysR family transcriptional regulator n=1 Tax=Mycolicibacterium komossense TaxID=1779 RepID=A0ABT3C719_9MYCO|nr:LysR family transcriptional regulator [Mycolicibacterium komossense]MCV7225257.1 LysR family transcriptional regulator [Mycolicibacterium komossense]
MIDVGALRALRSVALLGTVAQAADELGFTPSAVSQQIKRLERQLGVAVLAPAGRKVVLTPAGQVLVDAAPDVFHALERCVAAAQSVSHGTPIGVLRVDAFSTGIRGLIAPSLAGLAAEYPDLDVRVTEQDPDRAVHSLDSGNADVALIHDADGLPTPLPPVLTQKLVHIDYGDVVVRRDHPLAQLKRDLTSDDLGGCAWVTSPEGTVCHRWFQRLVAGVPEQADVRHMVDDFSTQLSIVEAAHVVALIPRLARPPLTPAIVALPLSRPPRREVFAAWRRSADASPLVHAFVSALNADPQTPQ